MGCRRDSSAGAKEKPGFRPAFGMHGTPDGPTLTRPTHLEGVMMKANLDDLDMNEVRGHYDERLRVSKDLQKLLGGNDIRKFVNLALGISSVHGNYSAHDHNLGPRILSGVEPLAIFQLAQNFITCLDSAEMLAAIYTRRISYLKISVGSEIAMMIRPNTFWVANTRSVWAHLLAKHKFNYRRANEELALYRSDDEDSEMHYEKWRALYFAMREDLVDIGRRGDAQAAKQKVKAGRVQNIWFDAIASGLYEHR
jgi:hypothetical protein